MMMSHNVNGNGGDGGGNDDGASISKSNALFHQLLGDDASALLDGGNNKKSSGDETSTAMSSVLGPILRANNNNGDRNYVGAATNEHDMVPPLRQLFPRHAQQQQQQQQQVFHNNEQTNNDNDIKDTNDEDTYMTKPREISFDMHSDDVSALFGGNCGASTTGGMGGGFQENSRSNYGASYAAQRKNRQRGLLQWQQQQPQSGRNMRQAKPTETNNIHGGVDSILEEIGFRASSSSKKNDFDEGSDGKNKGRRRWSSSRFASSGSGGGGDKKEWSATLLPERIRSIRTKYWIALLVGIMYLSVQFRTVRNHDQETMDHLNWRFQNHHIRSRPSVELSDVMRRIAVGGNENGGVGRGGYASNNFDHRFRSSVTGEEERLEMEFLKDDGKFSGEASRKHMPPISKRHALERKEMLLDDDFTNGSNLRGGGGGVQSQPLPVAMQRQRHSMDDEVKSQQQLQHQQQQEQQHPGSMLGANTNVLQPQQEQQQQQNAINPLSLGDTHPLLQPKQGLSMADALDKLGTDKLSDIDPRPQQLLSNDIIPPRFQAFADVKTPYVVGRETPFFWHIPRSGGVVVKTMLSHCLGQTLAAEVGEMDGHLNDSELKVISFSEHNYVNVNVATPEGITRALNLGLVPSHMADTVVSAHVDLVTALFNANDHGRAFVLLRHPVDRAASMFYFLKASGYAPLKDMTLDDYAKSDLIENNWLVRMLSEAMTGPIDMDNLEIAKEVLRRKFIVGLLDNKRGSFARFDHYFKWKDGPNYEKEFGCRKQLMDEKYTTKHPVRKDSDTWKLLLEQNRFDVHLYDFAKELFSQQSYIFGL